MSIPASIQTHHDTIPIAGHHPSNVATSNNRWNDPGTWDMVRVPNGADSVYIPMGVVLYLDGAAGCDNLAIDGSLELLDNFDLTATTITVLPEGELRAGSMATPVHGSITFRDLPLDPADTAQWGHGLLVFGGTELYGQSKDQFVRLATAPAKGDFILQCATQPLGWQPGDVVALPDSRQLDSGNGRKGSTQRRERVVVARVNGRAVELVSPLLFTHPGTTYKNVTLLPHVANLSMSIVIQSAPRSVTRAHCVFLDQADVTLSHVEFADLGRTNNTRTAPSTNQIGRYPVHFHHLEKSFAIDGCVIRDSRKWPLAVHDSHFGWINANVICGGQGAGIAFEDGSETGNKCLSNYVTDISGAQGRGKSRDGKNGRGTEGDGIWCAGPRNVVSHNVVADCDNNGYTIYGGDNASAVPVQVPTQPGDGHAAYVTVKLADYGVMEFADNEAYSVLNGLELWYLGFNTYYRPSKSVTPTAISDFRAWHCHRVGIFGNSQQNVRINAAMILGDPAQITRQATGIHLLQGRDVRMSAGTVAGYKTGIDYRGYGDELGTTPPVVVPTLIESVVLDNGTDLLIAMPLIDQLGIPPRRVEVRACEFNGPVHVRLSYRNLGNVVQPDEVFLYGYQGGDWRAYYNEQDPTFIVPQTQPKSGAFIGIVGCPVAGLTNQQAWAQFGVAIAGAVSPTQARMSGVVGFLERL